MVEVYCTNGKKASSWYVDFRGGRKFIYGYYYEGGKRYKCYVGPADPELVLHSMPVAFLVAPRAWSSALSQALESLIKNIDGNRALAAELRKVLEGALARLAEVAGT